MNPHDIKRTAPPPAPDPRRDRHEPTPAPTPAPPKPTPPPTTEPAPAGVFYQPSASFGKWASRGINALWGFDAGSGDTLDEWCVKAKAAGLRYWLQCYRTTAPGCAPPVFPLAIDPVAIAHANDPNLIGWILPDEPNGVGNIAATDLLTFYRACKSVAPHVDVYCNLDGGHILQFGQAGAAPYLACCDVPCSDHYPDNYDSNDAGNLTVIANDLRDWKPCSKSAVILECSNQGIAGQSWCAGTPLAAGMRAPTAADMQAEFWDAKAGGITAIVYFPQFIGAQNGTDGGFSYDDMNLDEIAAMAAINKAWTAA